VFGTLSVVASVSVANHFSVIPLVVIGACACLSALYVIRILPKVRASEQSRRAATGRRRPPRADSTGGDEAGSTTSSSTPDGGEATRVKP